MYDDRPFGLVFPIPDENNILQCETPVLLAAYMLMKLAGQVVLDVDDMKDLGRTYAGFTVSYDPKDRSFVARLRVRPSENPRPGRP